MKIKEIILKALPFTGYGELVESLEKMTSSSTSSEPINRLTRIAVNVLGEIAEGYVPLVTEETVSVTDGKISYGSLSQDVAKVISVCDENGVPVSYEAEADGIKTGVSSAKVRYRYFPVKYRLDGEVYFDGPPVSAKTVAYGIAGEYFMTEGDYALSNVWNRMFYESLSAQLKRKGLKLKGRRWI